MTYMADCPASGAETVLDSIAASVISPRIVAWEMSDAKVRRRLSADVFKLPSRREGRAYRSMESFLFRRGARGWMSSAPCAGVLPCLWLTILALAGVGVDNDHV